MLHMLMEIQLLKGPFEASPGSLFRSSLFSCVGVLGHSITPSDACCGKTDIAFTPTLFATQRRRITACPCDRFLISYLLCFPDFPPVLLACYCSDPKMILFPRCSVFASLQATLLILLYAPPLIAADPTVLERLYNLVKAGNPGSCASQLSDLKTAYREGLAMAQAAIDAIDAIKGGKSSNWVMTSKNNRKAKMLQAMFSIRAASLFKPISSGDSAALDTVRGMYILSPGKTCR